MNVHDMHLYSLERHQSVPYSTGEGVVGVEDINLLPSVPVDVARCHSDGVALTISQGVERRAAVVNGDVDEPPLLFVVLEHQVWAVVAVNTDNTDNTDHRQVVSRLSPVSI